MFGLKFEMFVKMCGLQFTGLKWTIFRKNFTLSIQPHPKLCIVFINIMEIMKMAEKKTTF